MTTEERVVFTTLATPEQAASFARALVDVRLAACVSIYGGATSFYRWQSEVISEDVEQVLMIKTHQSKLTALEEYFARYHPYECPEFLVVDVAAVSSAYGKWLRDELRITADKKPE
jgi:periplasmic divalent cation tolerance protein